MPKKQPVSQPPSPARLPLLVRITQLLFFLNAAAWVVFGVLSLTEGGGSWPIALLMLANAAVLAGAGWGLGTRRWWCYYLALLVLLVNTILAVTNQSSLFYMLAMALNAVMLVLLVIKRSWYIANR